MIVNIYKNLVLLNLKMGGWIIVKQNYSLTYVIMFFYYKKFAENFLSKKAKNDENFNF